MIFRQNEHSKRKTGPLNWTVILFFFQGEYEELCSKVNAISSPMASRKLAKKLYKLIKKNWWDSYGFQSSGKRGNLRQGLAEVNKAIRHNETGIVVLAGDVSPIDIYSHVPGLCESRGLLYIFTPSKEHLGLATGTNFFSLFFTFLQGGIRVTTPCFFWVFTFFFCFLLNWHIFVTNLSFLVTDPLFSCICVIYLVSSFSS
ncbi:unnamed protein product [Enterobius vermicularis]|uniref:Ribosomal_L7Ae domain-containing protein n=1 Tax=Enterobius vermicularis TaxID=51028 RepID=A0A0N4V449_ENTVE|nr:unnamed protein product [Enterobius vermicularis]